MFDFRLPTKFDSSNVIKTSGDVPIFQALEAMSPAQIEEFRDALRKLNEITSEANRRIYKQLEKRGYKGPSTIGVMKAFWIRAGRPAGQFWNTTPRVWVDVLEGGNSNRNNQSPSHQSAETGSNRPEDETLEARFLRLQREEMDRHITELTAEWEAREEADKKSNNDRPVNEIYLIEGGVWTKDSVRLFLGEPDIVRPSRHRLNTRPERLYYRSRVEAAEAAGPIRFRKKRWNAGEPRPKNDAADGNVFKTITDAASVINSLNPAHANAGPATAKTNPSKVTSGLEATSQYILLRLASASQQGALRGDQRLLAKLAGVTYAEFQRHWPVVGLYFKPIAGARFYLALDRDRFDEVMGEDAL
jgi:hypothetical protein